MSTVDLRDAAHRFFRGPHRFSLSGHSSGYSGSTLARVEARGASWCLRGWPSGSDERRLRFVHRAILYSRAAGFPGVPKLATTGEGDTVLNLDGRLFDAQEWLPGKPLSGEQIPNAPTPNAVCPLQPGVLSSLTTAVARFHRSTADLEPEPGEEEGPILARLVEIAREAATRREALLAGVRARATTEAGRVALRWLELLPAAVARAEADLRHHPTGARRVSTLCHGDLWASHAHFDGQDFVGLVDFESLRFGSPAVDLAQLVLHFNGWGSREAVLNAYERIRPLEDEDRALLPGAAALDLASEGLWSLDSLYGEKDPSPAESRAHENNLRALLESLEMVVDETKGSPVGPA